MEFEEVYRKYVRDVYRFSLSLTQDRALAEEITQDTFFRALKSLDRFDGSKDTVPRGPAPGPGGQRTH